MSEVKNINWEVIVEKVSSYQGTIRDFCKEGKWMFWKIICLGPLNFQILCILHLKSEVFNKNEKSLDFEENEKILKIQFLCVLENF